MRHWYPVLYQPRLSSSTPGVFYTNLYTVTTPVVSALKKILLSEDHFKPLLGPGGGFTSETAARWFQR